LDCLDAQEPPFAKGTLQNFRNRLIAANLDRRLVERTVELAATPAAGRALRAALDSSPLWRAGRVEDTLNLMGHALRKALGVIAVQQGWGLAEGTTVLAGQVGASMLAASSLKAALDLDWDDPAARDHALSTVLDCMDAVAGFVAAQPEPPPAATAAVAVANQVRDQDVDTTATTPNLRRGVAKDRRISVEDPQMRHGRKSRSKLFDCDWWLVMVVVVASRLRPGRSTRCRGWRRRPTRWARSLRSTTGAAGARGGDRVADGVDRAEAMPERARHRRVDALRASAMPRLASASARSLPGFPA
jgi:hypothetical protein